MNSILEVCITELETHCICFTFESRKKLTVFLLDTLKKKKKKTLS